MKNMALESFEAFILAIVEKIFNVVYQTLGYKFI